MTERPPAARLIAVTTTSDDRQVLLEVAAQLVDQQLAACCQVDSAPITSVYRWQGQREQSTEYRCVIKTFDQHLPAVNQLIRAHHNYDCPQIVAARLVDCDEDYLVWARQACGLPVAESD